MTALCEFLLRGPGQVPDLMSLALVALIFWGVCALYRSVHWIPALLVLLVAFASDAIIIFKIFTSVGMPLNDAIGQYSSRLPKYLAPWIVVAFCFLAGSALDFLAQRKLRWLPALLLGVLFISVQVLILTVGWEVVLRIPKYGWGLQYTPLLPLFLLISMLAKFPVKNITPPEGYRQSNDTIRWIMIALLLVFLVICPKFTSDYFQSTIVMIGMYAIAIYGLNILTGLCGQVCASQWAMFGIGAFTAAIANTKFGYNLPHTLAMAGIAAASMALLLGLFSFLNNYHLGILTVIFSGMIVPAASSFESFTGGPRGLIVSGRNPQLVYYITMAFMVIAVLLYEFLSRSRIGRKMVAVREERATSLFQIYLLRVFAFTLCGVLAGIAGSLYTHRFGFLSPQMFDLHSGVFLLCILIIGAMGTRLGPLVAIAGVLFVQEYVFRALDIKGAQFIVFPTLAVGASYVYWYVFRIRPRRQSQTEDSSDTETPLSGLVHQAGA